jgi:hypothetical protein
MSIGEAASSKPTLTVATTVLVVGLMRRTLELPPPFGKWLSVTQMWPSRPAVACMWPPWACPQVMVA